MAPIILGSNRPFLELYKRMDFLIDINVFVSREMFCIQSKGRPGPPELINDSLWTRAPKLKELSDQDTAAIPEGLWTEPQFRCSFSTALACFS